MFSGFKERLQSLAGEIKITINLYIPGGLEKLVTDGRTPIFKHGMAGFKVPGQEWLDWRPDTDVLVPPRRLSMGEEIQTISGSKYAIISAEGQVLERVPSLNLIGPSGKDLHKRVDEIVARLSGSSDQTIADSGQ